MTLSVVLPLVGMVLVAMDGTVLLGRVGTVDAGGRVVEKTSFWRRTLVRERKACESV